MKPCKKCGNPETVLQGDGITWRCLPCHAAYMANYHATKTVRKTARRPGWCSTCDQPKSNGTKHPQCALAREKATRAKKAAERPPPFGLCRKCGGPSTRARPCKPCRSKYLSAHYDGDPEQYAIRNKKWKKANPDAVKAMAHRRLTLDANAEGYFTEADLAAIRKKQKGRCAYCRVSLAKVVEHVEHIHPRSKGGTNWPINICLSCPSCNFKKHARLLPDYQPSFFSVNFSSAPLARPGEA